MMFKRILVLVMLVVCSAGTAIADHIPDEMFVYFGDSGEYFGFSGFESTPGFHAEWMINNDNGSVSFMGIWGGLEGDPLPFFDLRWSFPGQDMPFRVNILSSGPGLYAVYPYFLVVGESEPDLSYAQLDLSGDNEFGYILPAHEYVSFAILLQDHDADYNLTVSMNWGDGVSNEERSWSQVKNLFR